MSTSDHPTEPVRTARARTGRPRTGRPRTGRPRTGRPRTDPAPGRVPASDQSGIDLPTIDLAQGTLTYRVAGPADSPYPPVVFVHGLLVDSLIWTSVAELLADQGIRSYAPNWPMGSHRLAMRPDAELAPRGMAGIVLDFLAALELEDVTLVGNDTGGAICQFVLDTDHTRIGRLVLTNCDAFDVFPPREFVPLVRLGSHPSLVKPLLSLTRPTFLRHSRLGFGMLFATTPDASVTRSWIEPCLTDKAIRRDAAKLMAGMRPKDLLDVSTHLGTFTKPVHLVWGDADTCFKPSFAERLADVFPDATITRVPGGRTLISLDYPDEVAAVIAEAVGVPVG